MSRVRWLFPIVLLLCACATNKTSATPVPSPPSPRPISEVNIWAPRDLADLEAIADTGVTREVLAREPGSTSTCPSLNLRLLEPEETEAQIAADLTRAMLSNVNSQCNGGNVWGFRDRSEATGQQAYTNGWIKLDNARGTRTARLIIGSETKWSVTY